MPANELTQAAGPDLPACLTIGEICGDTGLIHPEVRPLLESMSVAVTLVGRSWTVLRSDYLPVRSRLQELGKSLRSTGNKGGRPRRREAAVA